MAVIKESDPDGYAALEEEFSSLGGYSSSTNINTYAWHKVEIHKEAASGDVVATYYALYNPDKMVKAIAVGSWENMMDQEKLAAEGESLWTAVSDSLETGISREGKTGYFCTSTFIGYGEYTGTELLGSIDTLYVRSNVSNCFTGISGDAIDVNNDFIWYGTDVAAKEKTHSLAVQSKWDANSSMNYITTGENLTSSMNTIIRDIAYYWTPEDDSRQPLEETLGNFVGEVIPVLGTVLQQDQIPAIDRAAFVQYKHQMGDHFGLQAWYLRSVNDDTHSLAYAHGDSNDVYSYDQLANIIGLGAAWRVGDNLRFSFDWGQNRTDFDRMMNGNTIYSHESGTSDFDIEGRSKGGTPRFWVARVDVGHADMDVPGSGRPTGSRGRLLP